MLKFKEIKNKNSFIQIDLSASLVGAKDALDDSPDGNLCSNNTSEDIDMPAIGSSDPVKIIHFLLHCNINVR